MKNQNRVLTVLIVLVALVALVGLVVLLLPPETGPIPPPSSSQISVGEVSSLEPSSQETSSLESVPSEESVMSSAPASSSAKPVDVQPESKVPAVSSQPVSSAGEVRQYTKAELAEELNDWNLFLVNPDRTVDENWAPSSLSSVGNDQSIDSRILSAYQAMMKAAKQDGVSLWVVSGYRSYSKQNRLYNNRVTRAKNDNPSFTQAEAEAEAARHVARPGTSEHQLGLAMDFNSTETSFATTKAGKWLKKNAANYGFILRYEEDKQDVTKITYEPWHYRYVGAKHALTMQEKGLCLEEYIDWLKG